MSKQVRRRRGTTAEHSTFIGAQAEITVDTTKATAVVHDGTTLGGFPLAKEARQINTATGLLGGGDLTANRTISLNVPGLAQDAAVDLSTDYILTYDVAAAEHKRVLYSDFGVQYLWKVCRNESGVTITKGTPVYITGRNGDAITVGVADAANPAKMPAVGVVTTNLADNTNGIVVTSGFVRGVDAGAGVVGDTLYVAPGGGFTTAKPANPNLIQNVGKIVKEGSNGNLLIFGPGRTNDVPALADGHVFIGNSSGVTTQRALTFSDITGSAGNLTATGLTIAENTANESPLTVSGYSLTGSGAQSLLELSGTWNTSGTPTAIKLNVTDTASNANSLLMDLQTAGVSRLKVRKDGLVTLPYAGAIIIDASITYISNGYIRCPDLSVETNTGRVRLGSSSDVVLVRDGAAGILAQRNAANAQTSRIYGTYTDASNYTRLALGHNGTSAFINEEVAGTGTAAGIAVSAASLSGSQATSLLSLTQTWNTTGVPSAIKLNITNTASNASSRLLDLQVDGSSKFNVTVVGDIKGVRDITATRDVTGGGASITQSNVNIGATGNLNWRTLAGNGLTGSQDLALFKDAANTLAQRNGTSAQTSRIYGTYTDASNYTRLALGHNGTSAFISEEVAGTGTAGGIAVSAASLSGAQATSLLDLTQTWNTSGTPTAIKLNVTDTASNADSLIFDLRTDNTSRFAIHKSGAIWRNGAPRVGFGFVTSSGAINLRNDGFLTFSSSTSLSSGPDVVLCRDAASVLALRNFTATNTFRVYNTWTDASNYEAVELSHATYSGGVYSRLRTITAGTGADNINLVVGTSGTGAISIDLPDGTATGGNARGTHAVDFQRTRNQPTQVASGAQSLLLGTNSVASGTGSFASGNFATASGGYSFAMGQALTASATYSFAFGANCVASDAYCFAFGGGALARGGNQFARSGNPFAATGDSQASFVVRSVATTDATPTSMNISMLSHTRWIATATIVASTTTAGAKWASFERRFMVSRGDPSNTIALVGNVQTIGSDIGTNNGSPPAGWAVAIGVNTANANVQITVTGEAATTIRWVADVHLVEVVYA